MQGYCFGCSAPTTTTVEAASVHWPAGAHVCQLCQDQNAPAYFARREDRKRQAIRKAVR